MSLCIHFRSAPELSSLWNPTLRKTLSHPPTPSSVKRGDGSETALVVKQRRSAREKKAKSAEGDGRISLYGDGDSKNDPNATTVVGNFRKPPSLPISPGEDRSEVGPTLKETKSSFDGDQRKHSLPSDGRSACVTSQSPSKSRKHFLEGFRNPLRPKSKGDVIGAEASGHEIPSSQDVCSGKERRPVDEKSDFGEKSSDRCNARRWSETNSHGKSPRTMVRLQSSGEVNDTALH